MTRLLRLFKAFWDCADASQQNEKSLTTYLSCCVRKHFIQYSSYYMIFWPSWYSIAVVVTRVLCPNNIVPGSLLFQCLANNFSDQLARWKISGGNIRNIPNKNIRWYGSVTDSSTQQSDIITNLIISTNLIVSTIW